MLKIKRIDHIAVCVSSLDGASALWEGLLGPLPHECEHVASQGTDVMIIPVGEGGTQGGTSLELIAPHGSKGLERFLAQRGPGLHHVAFEVEGIEEAILFLKGAGVAMIDEAPRMGARGHKVAFLHPKATGGVLVELVEPEKDR